MYFGERQKWDSDERKCGMPDSREKGAGMRDQDPPFQTLLQGYPGIKSSRYQLFIHLAEERQMEGLRGRTTY